MSLAPGAQCRPVLAAKVSASRVRQEQRGAGVCGGWKRPEGVQGNKAGNGDDGGGGGGHRTRLEGRWALPQDWGVAGPRVWAAAESHPLPPAQGRRSSPPPMMPPVWASGQRVLAEPTDPRRPHSVTTQGGDGRLAGGCGGDKLLGLVGGLTAAGEPEAGAYGARCAAARGDGRCVRTCTRWAAGLLGPAPAAGETQRSLVTGRAL